MVRLFHGCTGATDNNGLSLIYITCEFQNNVWTLHKDATENLEAILTGVILTLTGAEEIDIFKLAD
jgi:hypothetical protein